MKEFQSQSEDPGLLPTSKTQMSALPPPNDIEGMLEKEGGTVKTWKIRWFCLNREGLHYYKTRKDLKPIDTIDLTDGQVFIVDDFYRKRKIEFLFQLKVPSRTFNLIAPDFDTRQSWVDCILARIPNQKEILKTKFNPTSSDLGSDESEPETEPAHAEESISEDAQLQQLVETSCQRCKATVLDLVSANPFNLLDACRKFALNANPVFSCVYQYIATSQSPEGRSELLSNISSLEQQLKELILAAKEHAVQAQYGKEEAGAETKRLLEECGEDFISTLEKLRPSYQNSESAKSSKKDYRASVMMAKSTLDSAINDLAQISGPVAAPTRNTARDTTASSFYDALSDIVDTFHADEGH